jgi:hypothetical protein
MLSRIRTLSGFAITWRAILGGRKKKGTKAGESGAHLVKRELLAHCFGMSTYTNVVVRRPKGFGNQARSQEY